MAQWRNVRDVHVGKSHCVWNSKQNIIPVHWKIRFGKDVSVFKPIPYALIWRNFPHWLHPKLSKWRYFRFNISSFGRIASKGRVIAINILSSVCVSRSPFSPLSFFNYMGHSNYFGLGHETVLANDCRCWLYVKCWTPSEINFELYNQTTLLIWKHNLDFL